MQYFLVEKMLLRRGWLPQVYLGIDTDGKINYLSVKKPDDINEIEQIAGAVLPGFRNSHSHAFQYAMAGQAEIHLAATQDDFWSWREAMYNCALTMSPDDIEQCAAKLYRQLLRNGYTSVVEFHYLHHNMDGKPYSNLAETGYRLLEAAKQAGINITLVPIFYQKGDFNKPPQQKQRRFISATLEDYFRLLQATERAVAQYHNARLGYGVHSLRAVDAGDIIKLHELVGDQWPFHLHAAEQLKEVARCEAALGHRPVQWLLNNLPLNSNFNLVHCTHMTETEIESLARSGANAILCPSTEGNLGDGIFPLKFYTSYNGNWAIGTDSQVMLNPLEDLRWLDYAQRLLRHERNTFDNGAATMIEKALTTGRKAAGEPAGDHFEIGVPFDAAIYDLTTPTLSQATLDNLLAAIVYTTDAAALTGIIVNGRWQYRK